MGVVIILLHSIATRRTDSKATFQTRNTTFDAGESVSKPDLHGDYKDAPPTGGTGSASLATDSTDPGELRALLKRARERLSFYEGFDRLIAENVRRSGELMLETLTMRETATANAECDGQEERQVLLARLADMNSTLDTIRAQIDSLSSQLSDMRASFGKAPVASGPRAMGPAQTPGKEISALLATESPVDRVRASTQMIDVIAHRVTTAATALSLQRYLGGLGAVVGVEAREFAEGVLRMQVTARQPLDRADLSGWTECGPVTILQLQSNIVEIDLG